MARSASQTKTPRRPGKPLTYMLPSDYIYNVPAKASTQQRVLEASIDMFNAYGLEAVSVQQISEALDISPGNFTYYFKKKSDLIAEHLNIFEKLLNCGMREYPSDNDPQVQVDAFNGLLLLSLRYRFLFISSNFILQNELLAPNRYNKVIASTKQSMSSQINRLIASKVLLPTGNLNDIDLLVESIWWQWLGSVLSTQLVPPEIRLDDHALSVDIAIHVLFLIHQYMEGPYFEAVYAKLIAMKKLRVSPGLPPRIDRVG